MVFGGAARSGGRKRRKLSSHERVASTTQRWRPGRSDDSIPRCAMHGMSPHRAPRPTAPVVVPLSSAWPFIPCVGSCFITTSFVRGFPSRASADRSTGCHRATHGGRSGPRDVTAEPRQLVDVKQAKPRPARLAS